MNGATDRQEAGARTYEFQISDNDTFTVTAWTFSGPFVVADSGEVTEGTGGKTTYVASKDLQPTTRYWWRARLKQAGVTSAWSTARRFKTLVKGYNRAGELYDPLTNGETMGTRNGNTTFIVSRGIRIDDKTSWVQYQLAQTLTSGEFSAIIEVDTRTDTDKSKILSMYNGTGDIVDHPWRCTVEKRGDGTIAWRFIAGQQEEAQIDTVGSERVKVDFGSGGPHFWKAEWGGGFNLMIRQGSETGAKIYDFGKSLGATYQPNPHICNLGSPPGRSGTNSQSVPGAIYRNVFVGNRPRPTSLGSALTDLR